MDESKCRLCGSDKIKEQKIGETALMHCENCDITYNVVFPAEEKLHEYYTDEYSITSDDIIKTEQRRIFRLPEQAGLISEIMKYKKPPARLLDIGCDKGFFIDEARRYGYDTAGVEPSAAAGQYAERIGLKIYPSLEEESGGWDIVTMWHSLEHLTDPACYLQDIKSACNPGAYLFIRVPAFDSPRRKLTGRRWIWFQPQNHYFHYSVGSLRFLLEKSGFEVLHIGRLLPNNRFTKKMNNLVNSVFGHYFSSGVPLRKKIARKYEDLTGEEIFAAAKLSD